MAEAKAAQAKAEQQEAEAEKQQDEAAAEESRVLHRAVRTGSVEELVAAVHGQACGVVYYY